MLRRLKSGSCSINVALLLWTAPEELVGMGLDGRGGEGPGLDGRGAEGPGCEGSGPEVCNL